MAKAISPVGLQNDLMQAEKLIGERFHRSTAEQIEYWADIGREVSTVLDIDDVFNSLKVQRQQGTLKKVVTGSVSKYQSSLTQPGYLERIDQNGNVLVGQFENGEFVPTEELSS